MTYELQSIRDRWTNSWSYFWTNKDTGKIIGDYFDSEDQAQEWLRQHLMTSLQPESNAL